MLRLTFISNSLSFCSILGGRSPSYHQKTCPEHTNMWSHLFPTVAVNTNASQCKCNACKGCLLHKPHLNVSSPKKMAAQSASIIQIYAESSPSRSLGSIVKPFNEMVFPRLPHCYTHGSIVKLYMCYAHSAFEQII